MRSLKIFTTLVLLMLFCAKGYAQNLEQWCEANLSACQNAINVCESDDTINCDDYMNKVMQGDFDNLPNSRPRPTR